MTEFMQAISSFAMGTSVWVYLFILFGKVAEVSLGTLRIVLINRGVRTIGALIAFVEIMLWLIIAASVLVGFQQDFFKGVVYAAAFALGNYIGSWLDEWLAFGLSSVQVIIPDEQHAKIISESLRARGFGVTSLDVHGRNEDHYMLMMTMKRNRSSEAIAFIQDNCPGAVISTSDIKSQRGAYLESRTRSGPLRIGK